MISKGLTAAIAYGSLSSGRREKEEKQTNSSVCGRLDVAVHSHNKYLKKCLPMTEENLSLGTQ